MKRFCLLIIVVTFIIGLFGCANNEQEKQDNNKHIVYSLGHSVGENFENPRIEVRIFCDYSKHEKYETWIKQYGLKYIYESSREKYIDNYFNLLNNECYNTIKNKIEKGKFSCFGMSEELYFTYYSIEDYNVDKDVFNALINEDFVTAIYVNVYTGSELVEEVIIK